MFAEHRATKRYCLVTSAHICNNPRVVKEADALHDAGHVVRVVAADVRSEFRARDTILMRSRPWTLQTVSVARDRLETKPRWFLGSIGQAVARWAFDRGVRSPVLRDQAASRFVWALTAAASSAPADIVIAHNLEALPAAARAARALRARLGFDIEDLHTGVLSDGAANAAAEHLLIAEVERCYLPQCDFLTASSSGIADEIVTLYGVRRPEVVLNVFPVSERRPLDTPRRDRVGPRPSLYWYSQVIGPDRGLEDVVAALPLLGTAVQLHLRGTIDAQYEARLRRLAAAGGVAESVYFHPPAAPEDLVGLASEHDIGLALEQPVTRNRALCVTNKLFTYMLAGLAVVATDTPGQRSILALAPEAGVLYPAGDFGHLAAVLRALLVPDALLRVRRAALNAALSRFCWEREQERLVRYLDPDRPQVGLGLTQKSALPCGIA